MIISRLVPSLRVLAVVATVTGTAAVYGVAGQPALTPDHPAAHAAVMAPQSAPARPMTSSTMTSTTPTRVTSAPKTKSLSVKAILAATEARVQPAKTKRPALRPISASAAKATPSARSAAKPAAKKATVSTGGYGCGPALAYLAAHAAPGFQFACPGYAYGNQAVTCVYHAPQCPNSKFIRIAVPCAAAYKNEASNSWVLMGESKARIDPFGFCH